MKQLTLIRHAKSSWKDSTLADFERPLSKRGKRDAPIMGSWLRSMNFRPDLLLSSPAKRAIKTARIIAKQVGYPHQSILTDIRLYEVSSEELCTYLTVQCDSADHIAVCGHNPGMTDFYSYLTDDPIDNIPTCGIVLLALKVSHWQEIRRGCGTVTGRMYPKALR